jgi:quinol monooxygenase YgiN
LQWSWPWNRPKANSGRFLRFCNGGRDVALAQDGCEGFEIYQGQNDTNRFMLVEHWSSVEKHAHFQKNVLEAVFLTLS